MKGFKTCTVCKKLLPKEQEYAQKYRTRYTDNELTKRGHEKCVVEWCENTDVWKQVDKILFRVFRIENYTQDMITLLNKLYSKYHAKYILMVVKENEADLIKAYTQKGFYYVFGIITNEVQRVVVGEQIRKEELAKAEKRIDKEIKIEIVDYKKSTNDRDISQFLDD